MGWISSSTGSFRPRDRTQVFALQADSSQSEPPGKPKNTGVGSLSLLQRIFLTQRLNPHLYIGRQALYQLSQTVEVYIKGMIPTSPDFCLFPYTEDH